ncbi:hypothetical protein QBC44DRAFT_394190 [Cladorrhinum sp. PSN332]|nr:hypothetical protein QBC44DRAFT_394190 [Cladorrhinum sp. PSN332]
MRNQTLLALAGASIVIADPIANIIPSIIPSPVIAKRATTTTTSHDLALATECSIAFDSLFDARPGPNTALSQWMITSADGTAITTSTAATNDDLLDLAQLCSASFKTYPEPPTEPHIAAEYETWMSQWRSWQMTGGPAVRSVASRCSKTYPFSAGNLLGGVASDMEECKTAARLRFGMEEEETPATTATSGSGSANPTGDATSTLANGAAGSGEAARGYFSQAAAVAFAAAVGAVVGASAF